MATRTLITSGTTEQSLLMPNMGIFLDILSGRIFKFRNANGVDINAGISDELIVTPKALSQSDVFSNTSIPLVLSASLSSKTNTFVLSTNYFLLPTNGFFFPNRRTKIQAQIFAFTLADSGCTGEICLADANTSIVVPNTSFTFNNTTWTFVNGGLIEVEAGKMYTIAVRKTIGSSSKSVQLRSATLTLKLQSI